MILRCRFVTFIAMRSTLPNKIMKFLPVHVSFERLPDVRPFAILLGTYQAG